MARPLTVRELAERLRRLPADVQDWPVTTEGCDCDGDAGSVDVDRQMRSVYIKRACEADGESDSMTYEPSDVEVELRKMGLLPDA